MTYRTRGFISTPALALAFFATSALSAQPPAADDARAIDSAVAELRLAIDKLRQDPRTENNLPDVQVYDKAVEWIVRHNEFFKPEYAAHTQAALKTGLTRATELATGTAQWEQTPGRKIFGYQSAVDESIQ